MNDESSRSGQAALSALGKNSTRNAGAKDAPQRTIAQRVRALLSGGERGSQLVEFALVAPMLLVVLTGMASFAMALYKYQQLGYATATAAQGVSGQYGLIADPCAQTVTDITASLPGWTAGSFTYTMYVTNKSNATSTYGPTTGSTFSCSAVTTTPVWAENYPLAIKVSYAYNWFPILTWTHWGSTNTFAPTGSLTVSESALVQ